MGSNGDLSWELPPIQINNPLPVSRESDSLMRAAAGKSRRVAASTPFPTLIMKKARGMTHARKAPETVGYRGHQPVKVFTVFLGRGEDGRIDRKDDFKANETELPRNMKNHG